MFSENAVGTLPSGALGKHAADADQGAFIADKRQRLDDADLSFDSLLRLAGCELASSGDGYEYQVQDPRQLRRLLEQRLTLNEAACKAFVDDLQEHLGPPEALRAALHPMTITDLAAPVTGDSFVRAMLNVATLQRPLSEFLLQRIPEFADDDVAAAGAAGDGGSSVPQLILGQFRWLDALADPHALTATLLEVLPAMPPAAQRHALTFLPEVAGEEDHEAVLEAVEALVQEDPAFVLPAVEALSSLALGGAAQRRVVDLVQGRFQCAEAEDLPAVVRFLLQAAGAADARGVVAALRDGLRFVAPSDPRLAVPDRKQKGRVVALGEEPEAGVLEALRQAAQMNPAAADALQKEVRSVTDPAAHRAFDLWTLVVLCTLGADRRKVALATLRKKFEDGQADAGWLEASVAGHAGALAPHFPTLLAMASHLVCSPHAHTAAAGAALYAALFLHFCDAYSRQEVLRTLHAHLGARAQEEATAALGVLRSLARTCTSDLLQYAAFLTNVLDYVAGYSDDQLAAVFEVFAELVAGACAQQAAGAGGRSRMEDELFIFLRKQLSGGHAAHRRVGVVGALALVQRLGAELRECDEPGGDTGEGAGTMQAAPAEGNPLVQRYAEARGLLDRTLSDCRRCPESFSFLFDELARAAQRGALSRRLMADLNGKLLGVLEETFVVDKPAWITHGRNRCVWWDLNGDHDDIAIALMPSGTETASAAIPLAGGGGFPSGGGGRAGTGDGVAALFPLLRAVSALLMALRGTLEDIDALLGMPLGLFTMQSADPVAFACMAPVAQRSVLLGLFYAANWCRETVNAFGPVLTASPAAAGTNLYLDLKLFSRLRGACQLEAALAVLLPLAPPLFTLPSLSATLPALTAAPLAAKAKKSAMRGAKGGAKKKEVQFPEDAQQPEDAPGEASAGTAVPTARQASQHERTASRSTLSGSTQMGGTAAAPGAPSPAAALAAERPKFRELLLAALPALRVGADAPDRCYSMLPPVAYVLSDLSDKLRVALTPPRRAAFSRPAAARAGPAAPLPAGEVLSTLGAILPALRKHLDTALHAITEQLSDGAMAAEEQATIWDAAFCTGTQTGTALTAATFLSVIDGCPAAKAAVSPAAAAPKVSLLVLECLRRVLAYGDITAPQHRPVLQTLLTALASGPASPASQQAWSRQQLMEGCKRAFVYLLKAVPNHEEDAEPVAVSAQMDTWHSLLLTLDALLTTTRRLTEQRPPADTSSAQHDAKRLHKMRATLQEAAEALLRQRWPSGADAGEALEVAAGGWRGRTPQLLDALRLSITHAVEPVATVTAYVTDSLVQVTSVPTGKGNSEPLDDWPSLSGATLAAWYRTCWEVLLEQWTQVVASALATVKDKVAAAAAADGDSDIASTQVRGVAACAEAFAELLGVLKLQTRRAALHGQALKSSGRFMEGLQKVVPFWGLVYEGHREQVMATVKTVQKGTRLLHTLCAEGKTRRDMALTARVPQLKRTMERFVLGVVAFLRERDPGLVVSWGELKHKDLAGNTLHSSQMYPDQGEDEDDEETVLDEGGGEEGEEVTGESQAEMEYEDAEAEEDEY